MLFDRSHNISQLHLVCIKLVSTNHLAKYNNFNQFDHIVVGYILLLRAKAVVLRKFVVALKFVSIKSFSKNKSNPTRKNALILNEFKNLIFKKSKLNLTNQNIMNTQKYLNHNYIFKMLVI